ncbi:MAG: hypothetical protein WCK86_20390, partial [Planctomycetia bacterium]
TSQIQQLTINKPVQTKPTVITSVAEVISGGGASNAVQQITLTKQTPPTPVITSAVSEVTKGIEPSVAPSTIRIAAAATAQGSYSLSYGSRTESIRWAQSETLTNRNRLLAALQKITGKKDVSVTFDNKSLITSQVYSISIPGFSGNITAESDSKLNATIKIGTSSAVVTETTAGYTSVSQVRLVTINKPVQPIPTVTTSVVEARKGVNLSSAVQQVTLTKQTPPASKITATVSELTAGKASAGTVRGLTIYAANEAQGRYSLSYGGKSVTIIWSQNDVTNNSRKLRDALQELTGVSDVSVKFDQDTLITEQRYKISIPGFSGVITVRDINLGASFQFDTPGTASPGINETQQVNFVTGTASGTFRLLLPYRGVTFTTTELSVDASAASIQSAINTALAGVGTVSVSRTNSSSGFNLSVTFTGGLGSKNLELLQVQTTAVTPSAGGTFTLSFGGQTTAAITLSSNTDTQAADMQAALRSLSTVGAGNVQVSYDNSSTTAALKYTITFSGSLAGTEVSSITASGTQLRYAAVKTGLLQKGAVAVGEQQTVTLNSGTATGTFRLSLTVDGHTYTTTDLAFDATGGSIQTGLNTALGLTGAASVTRPGSSGSDTFDVTFSGALTGKDLSLLKIETDVARPMALGSFTLSYGGQTTAAISLANNTSAQASQIQQALQSLSSIGAGNISVQYDSTSANADTAPSFVVTSDTIGVQNITGSASNLTNGASLSLATIAGTSSSVNEVQTIVLETGAASGTFTITVSYNGSTYQTSPIAFDATAATIQSGLNTALSGIGSVTVSRTDTSDSSTLTLTFSDGLGGKHIQPVTVRTNTSFGSASGINEVQQVIVVTNGTSGTFRLSLPWKGRTYTTTALSVDASAASIQDAMNTALSGVGTVSVSRTTSSNGFTLSVTFTAGLGSKNLDLLQVQTTADTPPAGGTFTLSFGGQTTSAITLSSNTSTQVADIQTALQSLSTIGAGNVQVRYDTASTTAASKYTVTFSGSLAGLVEGSITASDTLLRYAAVKTGLLQNGSAAASEKQTVTLNSGTASGTFRLSLTVDGRTYTTTDLTFDATGSSIQTALNAALGTAVTVSVTRPGPSGSSTFDVTFSGALAGKDLPPIRIYTDVVTPTAGGSFTLSYGGQTTTAISLADSTLVQAAQIQQALQSLSTIGAGNISVKYDSTSSNADTAPRFVVTSGTISVADISATGSNLTNGANLSVSTVSGSATSVNEVQTITLETGTASGTFTLTVSYNGNTYQTSALAFDATAATIQSALNSAISSVGSVTVSRSGTSGSAQLTITFGGNLSGKNIDPVIVTTSTATPTAGGSFTVTYGGQTTRAIRLVNSSSTQAGLIQTELERLSNLGSGNVEVTLDSTSSIQQPRFRVALKGT